MGNIRGTNGKFWELFPWAGDFLLKLNSNSVHQVDWCTGELLYNLCVFTSSLDNPSLSVVGCYCKVWQRGATLKSVSFSFFSHDFCRCNENQRFSKGHIILSLKNFLCFQIWILNYERRRTIYTQLMILNCEAAKES